MSLLAVWQATVKRDGAAPAIGDAARPHPWTRRELDARAQTWAARVRSSGAHPDGRAIFFAEANGAAWFERFLGIAYAGGVPAPLDPGEPPAAQRAIARAAGGAYFATAGGLEKIPGTRALRSRAALFKTTSGSVGRPRALAFTAEQMLADGRQIMLTMGIRPADLNFALIPLGHSYGLGNLVIPLLSRGTAMICSAGAVPHAWAEEIRRHRPTVFPAVPPVLAALAESEVAPADLHSLRVVISAGSPLAPEIAQRFQRRFRCPVHNFYGSSETGGIAYDRTGQCTLTGRGVGRPMRGVRLGFGRGGRFRVESAAVAGGSFRPADRGCLNARGELVLLGRTGRAVKLGGRRVDLAEVEQALLRLPGITGAHVFLPSGSRGLAAAVAGPGAISSREVTTALQPVLAAWKIPRRWVAVPQLPVTARGKTDRPAVRALFA